MSSKPRCYHDVVQATNDEAYSWVQPAPRKGLYLLYEGLPETVVDSQVLLHVREMRAEALVDFEVWAFACSRATFARSQSRCLHASTLSGGTVRLFRGISVRPALPASVRLNALLLRLHLAKLKPAFEVIHARTDYAALVASFLKPTYTFDLIWDCRGSDLAEFTRRYVRPMNPITHLRGELGALVMKQRLDRVRSRADRAIFVTPELRDEVGFVGRPSEIIPCAASERLFHFDPELRERARAELGYSREDRLFVYSGNLQDYQCFPQCVQLFGHLRSKDTSARLLVLTPEIESARSLLRDLPAGSATVLSTTIEGMNRFLNAADFGLLLRSETPVNRVASPTKFAEYCLAGLPVLMTRGVPSAVRIASQLDNGIVCRFPTSVEGLRVRTVGERMRIAGAAAGMLSRRANRGAYQRLYAAQNMAAAS